VIEICGNPYYEVMGVSRYWRYSKEKMEELIRQGGIIQTRPGAVPQYKCYLDEMPGVPVQNLWDDVPPLNNRSREVLGYPTQKPLALLERIITASSNPGDVVLDPFCGCGTAIDAAQRLSRRWIGIDITHLAITLIRHRLQTAYGSAIHGTYTVKGESTTLADATALAESDPYAFQWWALGLVGARPVEQKKGADRGIDGRLYFHEQQGAPTRQIIFSVKAGKVDVSHVRDLRGMIEREKAQIGVLISLREPTRAMRTEAASAGFYTTGWNQSYPRLQLLTVAELLRGAHVAYSRVEREQHLQERPAGASPGRPGVPAAPVAPRRGSGQPGEGGALIVARPPAQAPAAPAIDARSRPRTWQARGPLLVVPLCGMWQS
jgi:hypothetical protein